MIPIEQLPVLAIVAPLFTSFVMPLLGYYVSERVQGWVSTIALACSFIFCLMMIPTVWNGKVIIHAMGAWKPPFGIILAVDSVNAFVAVVVTGVCALASAYSLEYMKHDYGLVYYYALLLLMVSGMVGVTLTGDLFNTFVFLEIMSVACYGLVAFRKDVWEPLEAGFKYCIMGGVATTIYLLGISLLYGYIGTLNMADIADRLSRGILVSGATLSPTVLTTALILLAWGLGLKAAIAPMHTWLPDAHPAAPSPMSAILSGVYVKVAVYMIARLVFTIYGVPFAGYFLAILVALSLFTMIISGFIALVQNDIKRMLAFSTVLNIGYISLGIGVGTQLGVTGGLFHLLNHALAKALLFLGAGAVIFRTGTRNMEELGGLARRMPVTAGTFILGSLAISGVPPFNCFWSELTIYAACIASGNILNILGAVVMVVMSAVALAFYIRAINRVFFGASRMDTSSVTEVPLAMKLPLLVLTALCVLIGVYPQLGVIFVNPAATALFSQASYIRQCLGAG